MRICLITLASVGFATGILGSLSEVKKEYWPWLRSPSPFNVYPKIFKSFLAQASKRNLGEGLQWGKRGPGDFWDRWQRQKELSALYWGNDLLRGKKSEVAEPIDDSMQKSTGEEGNENDEGVEEKWDTKEIIVPEKLLEKKAMLPIWGNYMIKTSGPATKNEEIQKKNATLPLWWKHIIKPRYGKRSHDDQMAAIEKRRLFTDKEDLDKSLLRIRVGCAKLRVIGEVLCRRIKGVSPDTSCSIGSGMLPLPNVCGDESGAALKKNFLNRQGQLVPPPAGKYHKIFVRI